MTKKDKEKEIIEENEGLLDQESSEIDVAKPMETAEIETPETPEMDKDALIGELKDKHLRLYSEFENFRRRSAKERLELIAMAGREIIESLLPILDDFERAKQSAQSEKADLTSVTEGMDIVQHKFQSTLTAKGLKKMETQKGDEFNEEFHEAVTQIPAEKELEGKIVDIIEPGYFLNDRVVRFAKVVTGAKQ